MIRRTALFISAFLLLLLLVTSCGTPGNPSDPLGDFPTLTQEAPIQNTGEALVRILIADIQLAGNYDSIASLTGFPEAMDAIQRWDQGIRVVNIDQFERKMVGGNWSIVYVGTETSIDGMDVMLSEVAPVDDFEARVRYILVDIQLSGDGYYRSFPDDPWAVEAIRRWDLGIRVANIDQFERKIVGTWQIVYFGTETTIDGMDVILTEAAGEATVQVFIAYPSEGDLPIPGDIYLYLTNVYDGTEHSTSWTGEYSGSIIIPAPGTYSIYAWVIRSFDPTAMTFINSTTCLDNPPITVNPGDRLNITLIFCP